MPDNSFTIKIMTGGAAGDRPAAAAAARRMPWYATGAGGAGLGAAAGAVAGGPLGALIGLGAGGLLGKLGGATQKAERQTAGMSYAETQTPVGRLKLALSKLTPENLGAGALILGFKALTLPVKTLVKGISKVAGGFLKLGPTLVSKIVPGFLRMGAGLVGGVGGAVGGAAALPMKGLKALFRPMTRMVGEVLAPFKPWAMLMQGLEPLIKLMQFAVRPIIGQLQVLFFQMGAQMVPTIRKLGGSVARFITSYGPALIQFAGDFVEGLSAILRLFTDSEYTFADFTQLFNKLWDTVAHILLSSIQEVGKKIGAMWKGVTNYIGESAEKVWNYVTNNDVFKWVAERWHKLMGTMRVGFAKFWNWMLEIPIIGRAVKGLGFGKIDVDVMKGVWEAQWTGAGEFLKSSFQGMADYVGDSFDLAFEHYDAKQKARDREKEAKSDRARQGIGKALGPLKVRTREELGLGTESMAWWIGQQTAAGQMGKRVDEMEARIARTPPVPGLPSINLRPELLSDPEKMQEPTVGAVDNVANKIDKLTEVTKNAGVPVNWAWQGSTVSSGGL